jgi:hypothetical protein
MSKDKPQNEIRTKNVRIMSKDKLQNEIRTNNVRIMSKDKLQNEIRTNHITKSPNKFYRIRPAEDGHES